MEDRDVNLPQIKNFVNYIVIYGNLCKFTIFVVCLGEILIYLIFGAFRLTCTVFSVEPNTLILSLSVY